MFRAEKSPASCRKSVFIFPASLEVEKINKAPAAIGRESIPALWWPVSVSALRFRFEAETCLLKKRFCQLRDSSEIGICRNRERAAQKYLRRRNRFVEEWLGNEKICERCGATLATYAELCSAPLDDPCPGFMTVEAAIAEFDGPGAN